MTPAVLASSVRRGSLAIGANGNGESSVTHGWFITHRQTTETLKLALAHSTQAAERTRFGLAWFLHLGERLQVSALKMRMNSLVLASLLCLHMYTHIA